MVAVDERGQHRHRHHRQHRHAVRVRRLAREERQEVGDDPPDRQDEDVDLGVAEDPEQVLVEERIAAARAPARRRRRSACRTGDRRGAGASPRRAPGRTARSRSRSATGPRRSAACGTYVMPGARSRSDGGDVVDRAHRRRGAGEDERHHPQRLAGAGRAERRRQRRIAGPARLRPRPAARSHAATSTIDATSCVQNDSRFRRRERHVARADLQRDAEVAEARRSSTGVTAKKIMIGAVHREQRRVARRRSRT